MRTFRPLSVCLTLMIAQPAIASAWSSDTDRILGDPAYLPLAGQVFGEFSYDYTVTQSQSHSTEVPVLPISGPPTYSDRSDGNIFLPSLSYGVTDDVSVSANLGFGNQRMSETYMEAEFRAVAVPRHSQPANLTGALAAAIGPISLPTLQLVTTEINDHSRSIGAEDPGFSLAWRAVDERTAPVNLDLSVSYAPDIFQTHASAYQTTGTRAFGGQRATANVAVSRELRLLTVLAYGTFTYNGRSDYGLGGSVERSGAHPAYAGGVQSQIRLLPALAVNTGAGFTQSAQYDSVDISSVEGTTYRTSETIRPALAITPYAGFVFPIFGPRLVGEVLYEHEFFGREKQVSAFDFGSETFDHGASLYSARLRFVFGAGRIL